MSMAIGEQLQAQYEVIGIGQDQGTLSDIAKAEIAIIAVKPQSYAVLAPELSPYVSDRRLVISIMAGVAMRTLVTTLGTERVVRTMLNLSLATGNSLTTFHAG